jgi:hypothetical protein
MKKFFSLEYFYELKTLFILESIILLLLYGLLNTPPNDKFLEPYSLFNIWALVVSIVIWVLSSLIDPKKYFNFFTLLSTGSFMYGCFWFLFEIMSTLPLY